MSSTSRNEPSGSKTSEKSASKSAYALREGSKNNSYASLASRRSKSRAGTLAQRSSSTSYATPPRIANIVSKTDSGLGKVVPKKDSNFANRFASSEKLRTTEPPPPKPSVTRSSTVQKKIPVKPVKDYGIRGKSRENVNQNQQGDAKKEAKKTSTPLPLEPKVEEKITVAPAEDLLTIPETADDDETSGAPSAPEPLPTLGEKVEEERIPSQNELNANTASQNPPNNGDETPEATIDAPREISVNEDEVPSAAVDKVSSDQEADGKDDTLNASESEIDEDSPATIDEAFDELFQASDNTIPSAAIEEAFDEVFHAEIGESPAPAPATIEEAPPSIIAEEVPIEVPEVSPATIDEKPVDPSEEMTVIPPAVDEQPESANTDGLAPNNMSIDEAVAAIVSETKKAAIEIERCAGEKYFDFIENEWKARRKEWLKKFDLCTNKEEEATQRMSPYAFKEFSAFIANNPLFQIPFPIPEVLSRQTSELAQKRFSDIHSSSTIGIVETIDGVTLPEEVQQASEETSKTEVLDTDSIKPDSVTVLKPAKENPTPAPTSWFSYFLGGGSNEQKVEENQSSQSQQSTSEKSASETEEVAAPTEVESPVVEDENVIEPGKPEIPVGEASKDTDAEVKEANANNVPSVVLDSNVENEFREPLDEVPEPEANATEKNLDKIIRAFVSRYFVCLEIEWKRRRDVWLDGMNHSLETVSKDYSSPYKYETFAEALLNRQIKLQIPFELPEVTRGNPILQDEITIVSDSGTNKSLSHSD